MIVIAIALITSYSSVYGQTSSKRGASPLNHIVVFTLDSVIDELREVESLEARVALAEDVIDLLIKKKPERCRQMLDSLFNDALQLGNIEDSEKQNINLDSVMSKIIGIAARFDKKLAESYVAKYAKLGEETSRRGSVKPAERSGSLVAGFLRLATELIEKDPTVAALVAEKSFSYGVTADTLMFLARLRKKDMTLANNLSVSALQSVRTRRGNDVNELFLLYAYVFSAAQVPSIESQTPALQQIPGYLRLAENNPINHELSITYLQTCAQLLLDPTRSNRMTIGQLSAGALGDYFFLKTIEPHISSRLPALSTSITARQIVLANYLNQDQRNSLMSTIERWNDSRREATNSSGGVEALLQQAANTPDEKQKDRLYFKVVMVAMRDKRYEVALETVEKLSQEAREVVKPFITYSVAKQSVTDNRLERAEQFARNDSDLERRAYIFTLIARALIKNENKDFGRAAEFLSEAEQISSKLDNRGKALVLVGVASVYANYDAVRASQLLQEIIKTANKVDGFTGDEKIVRSFKFDGYSYFYQMYGDGLTTGDVFRQQGSYDFNGTLLNVREIKNRLFRLKATVALCRGVLID